MYTYGHTLYLQDALPIWSADLYTFSRLSLSLGLRRHWRPRSFLGAVARAVPETTGVLIQFPLYGGIALILTHAAGRGGETLAHRLSEVFVQDRKSTRLNSSH